jgi:hypothetical protein
VIICTLGLATPFCFGFELMSLFAPSHLSLTAEHIFLVLELQLVIGGATILPLALRLVFTGAQRNESVTLEVVLVPLDSERIVTAVMHLSEQKVVSRVVFRTLNFELIFSALAHQETVSIELGLAVEEVHFTDYRRLLLGGAPTALEMIAIIVGASAVVFHDVPLMGTVALIFVEGAFVRV